MDKKFTYDDAYETCRETYATLLIYHVAPDVVSTMLGLTPTSTVTRGETSRIDGWFLTSRGTVDSKDARRHVDWILNMLRGDEVAKLRSLGADARISCYWVSKYKHGGPIVSPAQAEKLGALGLDLGFDIYF